MGEDVYKDQVHSFKQTTIAIQSMIHLGAKRALGVDIIQGKFSSDFETNQQHTLRRVCKDWFWLIWKTFPPSF